MPERSDDAEHAYAASDGVPERKPSTEGRRSHPATPVVRAWLWLLAAGAWAARSVLEGDGSYTEAGLVVGGAVLLGLGVGYVLWAFTYFVIDGTELRIDSGVLFKQSRRMPYERIQSIDIAQPLGARVFGLAELRIEMAGGEQSRTRLAFLRLDEARGLRRTLLEHTSGRAGAAAARDTGEDGATDGDRSTLITAVPPGRLIGALVLSTDFLLVIVMTALVAVALLVSLAATVFAGSDGLTASVLPLALASGGWLFTLVRSRIFEQWGFRLSYTSNGLRVDRGLFNRISQSIPVDRVQGVVIEQRLVWRLFGWYRLRVDTAGYSRGEDVKDDDSTSTLLPVGRLETIRHVVGAVLPGVDPSAVPTRRAPGRSAWFAPIGWRFRAVGYDERVIVVTRGWLTHRVDVVPHAKTQSVRTLQGPLQRRLGLADVVVDTTKGPVDAHAQSRDADDARRLATTQLDRARRARQD